MQGYPLFLNVENQPCLVFGGGGVATRKVRTLLKRGARVTCVSRDFSKALRGLAKRKKSQLTLKRPGGRLAIDGVRLVIVATSDHDFNARIARLSRKKKIWVNVVDEPSLCDFFAPAIVEKGPLQIAISTGGASPLFAKRLREALEELIPPSTSRLLEKLGRIRRRILRAKR